MLPKPRVETYQWASGHFLTNELPDHFMDMSDEALFEFIEQHVIEQYEYDREEHVWDMIEWLAQDTVRNLSRIGDYEDV